MIITKTIEKECSQFLSESQRKPIIKQLPVNGLPIRKVKLRKRNIETDFVNEFNKAFPQYEEMMQRALICDDSVDNGEYEPHYIYPINGYKYMYAENTTDIQAYLEQLKALNTDKSTVRESVQFIFKDDNLIKAIDNSWQIFFYNIPYCHAVRCSLVNDYNKLLNDNK